MLEGDLARLMLELKESSVALNRESESLHDVIAGVEEQLRALSMDLELWLDTDPLSTQELSVSASNVAPHMEVQLGFAPQTVGTRVEWHLQLREAEYAPQMHVSEEPDRKLMRVHRRKMVIASGREDLIAAVAKLPQLLKAYTEATRERIDVIRSARRLLEE